MSVTTDDTDEGKSHRFSDLPKISHNITMRHKDSESRFRCDLEGGRPEYVDKYCQISREYGLTVNHQKQYLHNQLHKDVLRYCLNYVEPCAATN